MSNKNIDLLFPDYIFDKKVSKYLFIKHILLSPIYIIIFILYPIYLLFKLFEAKVFSKILKQLLFIIYIIFMLVLVYTTFTQNKPIKSDEQVIMELKYRDKITEIR